MEAASVKPYRLTTDNEVRHFETLNEVAEAYVKSHAKVVAVTYDDGHHQRRLTENEQTLLMATAFQLMVNPNHTLPGALSGYARPSDKRVEGV